jgi:hypothetical protein
VVQLQGHTHAPVAAGLGQLRLRGVVQQEDVILWQLLDACSSSTVRYTAA